jgi:hypothetical protein
MYDPSGRLVSANVLRCHTIALIGMGYNDIVVVVAGEVCRKWASEVA